MIWARGDRSVVEAMASREDVGHVFANPRVRMDLPELYEASFSVGATDSNDNIASFSNRGPVIVDGSDRRKPDVSAPGVSVRSSLPTVATAF